MRYFGGNVETFKKSFKGKRGPTSITAFNMGIALRSLQTEDHKLPNDSAVSCLQALVAGGYYVDLVGTLGIALAVHNTAAVREVVERYLNPNFIIMFASPSLTGRNGLRTVVNDYEQALFCGDPAVLAVLDDEPFMDAYERWTKDRDVRQLPHYFDLAIYAFCCGDVVAGLELLDLAGDTFLRPYRASPNLDGVAIDLQAMLANDVPDSESGSYRVCFARSTLRGVDGRAITAPLEVFYVIEQ